MKALYFLFTAILCHEITFYVSPEGSDSNNGLSKETPWKWSWSTVST